MRRRTSVKWRREREREREREKEREELMIIIGEEEERVGWRGKESCRGEIGGVGMKGEGGLGRERCNSLGGEGDGGKRRK